MGKGPKKSRRGTSRIALGVAPRLKIFRPKSWYEGAVAGSAEEYVAHLLQELGRLGMDIDEIENHSRAPSTETVLSDLLAWFGGHPGEAYAKLIDWKSLDFGVLEARLRANRNALPRIEVSAQITKMQNLSVRWYPSGWHGSDFDWNRSDGHSLNLIKQRKWKEPPDFHWFQGDEDPYFDSRPSNELMFIHGVGNLHPEPRHEYGPFAKFNSDVVDAILICAVRTAYAGLVEQLSRSFEVTMLDDFEFVTRDEVVPGDPLSASFPVHRVVAWKIENAVAIKMRRENEAAVSRERQERADLAGVVQKFGFPIAALVGELRLAAEKKKTGPPPSSEHINTRAAKALREAGHKIDAGQVRYLRELLERYSPEQLPEILRPAPPPAPPSNVVPLRSDENS